MMSIQSLKLEQRANIIHDFVCTRLALKHLGQPRNRGWKNGIKVFALKFGELLFLRNKKFQKEGSVSNYATPSHKTFLKQGVIDPGYQTNQLYHWWLCTLIHTYTELKGIYLGCWSDGLEWFNKGQWNTLWNKGRVMIPWFIEESVTKKAYQS